MTVAEQNLVFAMNKCPDSKQKERLTAQTCNDHSKINKQQMTYCFCHFILSKFAGTHHVRLAGGSGNQTDVFFQSVNSGLHNKQEKKEKKHEKHRNNPTNHKVYSWCDVFKDLNASVHKEGVLSNSSVIHVSKWYYAHVHAHTHNGAITKYLMHIFLKT